MRKFIIATATVERWDSNHPSDYNQAIYSAETDNVKSAELIGKTFANALTDIEANRMGIAIITKENEEHFHFEYLGDWNNDK